MSMTYLFPWSTNDSVAWLVKKSILGVCPAFKKDRYLVTFDWWADFKRWMAAATSDGKTSSALGRSAFFAMSPSSHAVLT